MAPMKVIVQGLPWHVRYKEISSKRSEHDKIELAKFFATYGRVKCVYLWPEAPYVQWRKWEGMVPDKFAHLVFEHPDDAKTACYAAANREITWDDRILTLTRVSDEVVPIERLKDKMLVKIFSMLDPQNKLTIERVCKHWKELAPDSWRVKELDLGGRVAETERCLDATFEGYIKKCGKYLEFLTCDVTSPKFVDLIRIHAYNLKILYLWIYLKTPSPATFSRMFSVLKNLKKLEIHYYPDLPGFDIFKHLPKTMEKIHITYTQRNAYYFDVTKFDNLRSLSLRGFYRGLHLIGMDHMQKLIHLDFTGSKIDSILWQISHWSRLRALSISESHVNDDILIQLLRRNPRLEFIDISDNPALTDRSIQEVLWLSNLQVLKIMKLRVTLDIEYSVPSLKELHCEGCQMISDRILARLIIFAQKLQYLDVKNSSITPAFLEMADSALTTRRNNVPLRISRDWCKISAG